MTNIGVCQLNIYCRLSVCCVYVWVIVDFLLLSFKLSLGCLFSPHHVNQGGVQKTAPQVTLYLVLLLPHERACVELLHTHVEIYFGLPATEDGSTSIDVLLTKYSVC